MRPPLAPVVIACAVFFLLGLGASVMRGAASVGPTPSVDAPVPAPPELGSALEPAMVASQPLTPFSAAPRMTPVDIWAGGFRLIVSLGVVVVLIVGTHRVLRKLGRREEHNAVRIHEIRRLGPQHTLYLVEADGRRFLVGGGLSLVADLDSSAAALEAAADLREESGRPRAFGEHLDAMAQQVGLLLDARQ